MIGTLATARRYDLQSLTDSGPRPSASQPNSSATASVDYETDRLIQVTLRDMFPGTTLLVVAHRLQTIIDLDSVLVMEEGKCVEFNDAATLLDDPESFFSGLCDATGPATNLFLREQAEKARKKRSF